MIGIPFVVHGNSLRYVPAGSAHSRADFSPQNVELEGYFCHLAADCSSPEFRLDGILSLWMEETMTATRNECSNLPAPTRPHFYGAVTRDFASTGGDQAAPDQLGQIRR